MRPRSQSRGTVSLVALCFVAVLGISLASYLTICTRAMQLSNRSYQASLGQQLAELGLEEGLRAFNKGDWGGWSANPSGVTGATTAWTLDTTNKRASRTLTFDSTRLGQNVTATVKIRVDNYDANALGSPYNSSTSYRVGDLVGYNGIWYRCVRNNSGQTPNGMVNMAYWVPAPIASFWNASNTYKAEDVVYYTPTSSWYRCKLAPTAAQAPGDTTYWASIVRITVDNGYIGTNGEILNYYGTWYYYSAGWYPMPSYTPIISWCWRSGYNYSFNDLICYGYPAIWYRCIQAHTSGAITPTNTSYWENALSGTMSAWSSAGLIYNPGDVVYYSTNSQWYRCILGHTSSNTYAPTNTTYWAATPLLSQDWQPNRQYSQYDTVRYKGVWYLCLAGNNNQIPTNASSGYWAAAPLSLPLWNSAGYYEVDDLVNSGGTWYRCIAPHKNQTPPNATYWTVLTGSGSSYVWDAGTAYAANSYRSYGGAWYKCITATAANDGHTPNDSAYWSPTWAQPSNTSVVTGAPIVYSESTISIAGSPPIKTQIRSPIAPAPQFPNAVGSASTLTVSAAGTIDSYDGSVRAPASGGLVSYYTYNDQSNSPFSGTNPNIGYTATLAAAGTSSPSLTLTSTTVKGFVAATPASTSPFAPLASFGTSASLLNSDGTATSPDTTATNVDLSRISRSPYVPRPDTQPAGELSTAFSNSTLPRGLALSLATNLYLGTPGATTPSRYYYNGDLVIGGGVVSTVTILGPVILYINGDLQITGSGANVLTVTPTGSAEIHVADSLMVDAASNGIDNRTAQDPKKLIIICHTATSSTQYYGDVGNFFGTIYAPYTTNTSGLNLTSASSTPFYGALSAAKVSFSNSATVHYDTSLRYATFGGVDQPYTVTQWRQLPQTEQATMP